MGKGGQNRLSDSEKIARGTYRGDRSDAHYDAEAQKRVITGPWIKELPTEPEMPLGEIGIKKWKQLINQLHSQNKLTRVTLMWAELAAAMWEKIAITKQAGKHPSGSDFTQLNRALDALKIAEDAPPLTNPDGKTNKFAGVGFATKISTKARLLVPAADQG